jgi:hypothetical protein
MNHSDSITVLDRFLDPVTECLTPEVARRIVDLQLDPALQSRLDELATKASAGTLTQGEEQEYQDYVEGLDLVGIFKAKARLSLLRDAS